MLGALERDRVQLLPPFEPADTCCGARLLHFGDHVVGDRVLRRSLRQQRGDQQQAGVSQHAHE